MRKVALKRNGKALTKRQAANIVKDIKTYIAKYEGFGLDFYVIYFHFKIDKKHLYLVYAEPTFFNITEPIKENRYGVIIIKEFKIEMAIETNPPFFYDYLIQNEPIENKEENIVQNLFDRLSDENYYTLFDAGDKENIVFVDEKE